MFCPRCRSEYREGFATCGECQVPLVETLEEVEAAARHGLAPLLDTRHPALLHDLVDRLEAEEVPYAVQAGTALALLEGADLFGRTQPEPWRGILWVPVESLERARGLLEEVRRGEVRREPEERGEE